MGQDIRELFEKEGQFSEAKLSANHVENFQKKLDEAFPKEKKRFSFLRIAASIVFVIAGSYFVYTMMSPEESNLSNGETVVEQPNDHKVNDNSTPVSLSLGDISPDLKKVEQYYVTNINYELSQLPVNDENKQLLEGFLGKLSELDNEYKQLTLELNQIGPNEKTVNALIENLQLKLQLLYQLKSKLKELKESKNEQFINQNV